MKALLLVAVIGFIGCGENSELTKLGKNTEKFVVGAAKGIESMGMDAADGARYIGGKGIDAIRHGGKHLEMGVGHIFRKGEETLNHGGNHLSMAGRKLNSDIVDGKDFITKQVTGSNEDEVEARLDSLEGRVSDLEEAVALNNFYIFELQNALDLAISGLQDADDAVLAAAKVYADNGIAELDAELRIELSKKKNKRSFKKFKKRIKRRIRELEANQCVISKVVVADKCYRNYMRYIKKEVIITCGNDTAKFDDEYSSCDPV